MRFDELRSVICEGERPVVSFDFDGVLHTSMTGDTHHPDPDLRGDPYSLEPNEAIFKKMREEAKKNDIVVVTARDDDEKWVIEDFIDLYGLPVKSIHTTNNGPKTGILKKLKAIKHYDDHEPIGNDLRGTGIEFVHVK